MGCNTPSVDMFKDLGWLLVSDWLNYNKVLLTHRAINSMMPDYI